MSGTSLDGIDAALVEFDGVREGTPAWRMAAFATLPYAPERREQIHGAILHGNARALCRLHTELGEWFAEAALQLCASARIAVGEVDLIGSHGQTIWHEPRSGGGRAATLQLGCAATIAERTGIDVVSDFRARDTAAGGEGAPLVPWVDRLLFSGQGRRVLQNIGGMANLSWLPPRTESGPLLAFDTGPGNAMIDAAIELATGGADTYDRDGRWAERGTVDGSLLAELLAHPFFAQPPPRSTGRETFGRPLVETIAAARRPGNEQEWADLVATLTALTSRTIADSLRRWVLPRGVDEVILTGGGARNPVLRRMLEQALPEVPIRSAESIGIDPEAKEAIAFAALAWAFANGMPGSVPEATGAVGSRVLGSLTPGRSAAR